MASKKQIDANRQNARKSTGPRTPEGKAKASRNALKHGLTAQHAVLSDEERPLFEQLKQAFLDEHQPVGPTEQHLVEQMVFAAWRTRRIRGMETGLFETKLIDLADHIAKYYPDLDTHGRHAFCWLSEARGSKSFDSLGRHESRIDRIFHRSLHELQRLQARRAGRNVPPPRAIDLDIVLEQPEASPQPPEPLPLASQNNFDKTNPIRLLRTPPNPPTNLGLGRISPLRKAGTRKPGTLSNLASAAELRASVSRTRSWSPRHRMARAPVE